ncbi:MAG TPA: dipeptide ABC transporter ATP-binding protein [Clostridia bacterium]|nr:dipeptide ABC transporter ATP-binding protein [Clostridia bacterium]
MNNNCILEVKNLKKWFPVKSGLFLRARSHVKAVDDISFKISTGETLGLVGESGCGKSTLARTILRLIEPTAGSIVFDGHDISGISKEEMRKERRNMQIIFQDPFGSLHPKMKIGNIIGEPLKIHGIGTKAEIRDKVEQLIGTVGLSSEYLNRFPHEFSGGQRQRIVIARALALNPKLLVCDEPVSALDVSVRSQILNLLEDLQDEFKLTYLFISHDLSVVEHICSKVAVMYLGNIVELASKEELFNNPRHPYTQALLSSIPNIDVKNRKKRITLVGDIPSPINPPAGCKFRTRCSYAEERCMNAPKFKDIGNNHYTACWLVK